MLAGLIAGAPGIAQEDFTALARLDPGQSAVTDAGEGIGLTLWLSQAVPWRSYTLDAPPRLVVDFREVDFRGADPDALLQTDRATALRFGPFRGGWSRLVLDLAGPYAVGSAGLTVNDLDGTARLDITLAPVPSEVFAARSGAPDGSGWDDAPPPPPAPDDGVLTVVIDPGHGGIDPGAERGGLVEAHLMLTMGRELAEALTRAGMRPVLTRADDVFVPLADRMTIARGVGADALLSLHADALEFDQARGASVYTLSPEALDSASQRVIERHDQNDLLAGVDLQGQDDTVATALMELARLETGPAGERLADAIVAGLREAGAAVNSHPRRQAPLAVLTAADFPSVLVEVGFLSAESDRAALSSPEGRARIIEGIVAALQVWAADEAARRALLRQ